MVLVRFTLEFSNFAKSSRSLIRLRSIVEAKSEFFSKRSTSTLAESVIAMVLKTCEPLFDSPVLCLELGFLITLSKMGIIRF